VSKGLTEKILILTEGTDKGIFGNGSLFDIRFDLFWRARILAEYFGGRCTQLHDTGIPL
jgi:hypothetical protein